MNDGKAILLAACLTVVVAAPALCQTRPAAVSRVPRGYIAAAGGAAFAAENTPMLAVEYGDIMRRNLQAYATFSYFDNLMNERARGRLTQLGQLLTLATGAPWQFQGRDRAFAFSAGAKFLVPATATIRPYVGGGVGLINLKRTIVERTRGDITESFLNGFTMSDGVFNAGAIAVTQPFGEASFGAVVLAGRSYIDIRYRLRNVFHASDTLRFGEFGIGAGVTF